MTNCRKGWCSILSRCVQPDCSAHPFLDTSRIKALTARAGSLVAPKSSMTGAASPQTTPHSHQSMTPQPVADSFRAFPLIATGVSQNRLGNGSGVLASSPEETTWTLGQEHATLQCPCMCCETGILMIGSRWNEPAAQNEPLGRGGWTEHQTLQDVTRRCSCRSCRTLPLTTRAVHLTRWTFSSKSTSPAQEHPLRRHSCRRGVKDTGTS